MLFRRRIADIAEARSDEHVGPYERVEQLRVLLQDWTSIPSITTSVRMEIIQAINDAILVLAPPPNPSVNDTNAAVSRTISGMRRTMSCKTT